MQLWKRFRQELLQLFTLKFTKYFRNWIGNDTIDHPPNISLSIINRTKHKLNANIALDTDIVIKRCMFCKRVDMCDDTLCFGDFSFTKVNSHA